MSRLNLKSDNGPTIFFLALILTLAAGLRGFGLDFQSLWLDELYTMNMANPANNWADIYRLSFTHDPLSVLYFVLLNAFFKLAGYSALSAKLFSSSFGLAAVFMCFLLGKRLLSSRVGLFAAFLMAINPFAITYSQEARVYTMYLFTAALAFYCLLNFINRPSNKTALVYGLSVLLMLLSHFFGFFVLFSQITIYIYFALRDRRESLVTHLRLSILAASVCVLGYLPFVPIFIMLSKSKGTWIDPPGADALMRLYLDFQGGSWLLFSMGLVLILLLAFLWRTSESVSDSKQKRKDAVIFLVLWISVSFLVPFLLSIFHFPIFYKRYMISYLTPFLLLSAAGLAKVSHKWLRISAILAISLGTWYHLFPSQHFYTRPMKSDFRGVSELIMTYNEPRLPVYTSLPYHFGYYFRQAGCEDMLQSNDMDSLCNGMRRGALEPTSFWFADAHGRAFSVTPRNQAFLDSIFELYLLEERFDSWARLYLKKEKTNDLICSIERGDMQGNQGPSAALFVNGSLHSKTIALEAGKYLLVAKLLGTPARAINAEAAHAIWLVNNKTIAAYATRPSSFIQGDTLLYEQNLKGPVSFELRFDNDTCDKKGDRNLLFRQLQILPLKTKVASSIQ
jgi:hypothetical protein